MVKLVDAAEINLQGSKTTPLARYASQQGAEAWPLLEQALTTGSVAIRLAAVHAMRRIDAPRAERLVLATFATVDKKTPAKIRNALTQCVLFVGTRTAVAKFMSLGVPVPDELPRAVLTELVAYVTEIVPQSETELVKTLLAKTRYVRIFGNTEAFASLAIALIRHRSGEFAEEGTKLLLKEKAHRAIDVLEALGIPVSVETVIEACEGADARERLRLLSPRFATDRDVVARAIVTHDDPAWITILEPYRDSPPVFDALVRLREPRAIARVLEIAKGPQLDNDVKTACYVLGTLAHPEGAPVLLRWLAHPDGEAVAPMLLHALSECGSADDVPEIDRLSRTQPEHAAFFAFARDRLLTRPVRPAARGINRENLAQRGLTSG